MTSVFEGILPFVCVCQEGSFTAAAARLGVSKGAVSRSVQRLEAELGVKLLHRTTRAVALSAEGEALYARGLQALELVLQGRALAQLGQQRVSGELRVSLSAVLMPYVVKRLTGLRAKHPELRVTLRVEDERAHLLHDQVDVALRLGELEDSALVARRLHQTRWATVASPEYLRRAGRPERPDALEGHVGLMYRSTRGELVRWRFLDHDEARVPVALEADDGLALLEGAKAGLGLCQVFEVVVREALALGELVEVLQPWALSGPALYALCLPGQQHVPRVRAFLDEAAAWFEPHAMTGDSPRRS